MISAYAKKEPLTKINKHIFHECDKLPEYFLTFQVFRLYYLKVNLFITLIYALI